MMQRKFYWRMSNMTREEAIERAASWWVCMIYQGHWDNGDAKTEAIHSMMKGIAPQLKLEDSDKIHQGFVKLLGERADLYCDYGNGYIDQMFRDLGLSYSSSMHCPQKAGTNIHENVNGWYVEAKTGYGKPYERI